MQTNIGMRIRVVLFLFAVFSTRVFSEEKIDFHAFPILEKSFRNPVAFSDMVDVSCRQPLETALSLSPPACSGSEREKEAVNDSCSNALPITVGTVLGSLCGTGSDGNSSCSGASSADVWYTYTAEATETLSLSTFGSNYDTVLSVHTACPGNTANEIVCNDDCGNPGSCLTFQAEANRTYWIRVSGYWNQKGTFALTLSKEASLRGRITDEVTQAPLKGVQVSLYLPDGNFVKSAISDESGNYWIGGLTEGRYIARTFNSLGYVDELYDNQVCEGFGCTPYSATVIHVHSGLVTEDIDFALQRGGSITGIVTDAITGQPLSGIEVHFHDRFNVHISLDFTGQDGTFTPFDGLPPGEYILLALNSRGLIDELYDNIPCVNAVCDTSSATRITVPPGGVVSGIQIRMDDGGVILGNVRDSVTGLPVSGVQVQFYDSSGRRITTGTTDANGNYYPFDGLPTGLYYVRTSNGKRYVDELYNNVTCPAGLCSLSSGTPVPVQAGSDTAGIDFSLDPGGMIKGRVTTENGTGLFALVDLHDSLDRHVNYEIADQNGNYSSYYGLPTGQYFLRTLTYAGYLDEVFDNHTCVPSKCVMTEGTPVSVKRGLVTEGIDFQLEKGAMVAGKVTATETNLGLFGVYALVYDHLGRLTAVGFSDSCGNYESYQGLLTGQYFVRTLNSLGLIDEVYRERMCLQSCNPLEGTPLEITKGNRMEKIDFTLSRVLFNETFSDGILDWRVKSDNWQEGNGVLIGSSTRNAVIFAPESWLPSGVSGCSLCTIQFQFSASGGEEGKIGLIAWFQNPANRVELWIHEKRDQWKLKQISGGTLVARSRVSYVTEQGRTYTVRISYDGTRFQVFVDDQWLMTMRSSVVPTGTLGFRVNASSAVFDNILVY